MKQSYLMVLYVLVFLGRQQTLIHAASNVEEREIQMIKIDKYDVVKGFFKDFNIYETFLYSILENNSEGEVFVDDSQQPSFALVCTPSTPQTLNAYAYLAGEPNSLYLEKILQYLKNLPKTSLVAPLDWKFRDFFQKRGFTPVERVQLKRSSNCFCADTWKEFLLPHYLLCRIDERNFSRCDWRPFILNFYQNTERFLKNNIGFCLIDQGEVLGESYAFIANGKAELGINTKSKYRGQNMGTALSAIALEYCYQNALEPYWNCDVSNPASMTIAKKLGFEEDCRYLFLKKSSIEH